MRHKARAVAAIRVPASGFFLARRAHALEPTDARSAAAKENRQADDVLARFRGVRAERHGGRS